MQTIIKTYYNNKKKFKRKHPQVSVTTLTSMMGFFLNWRSIFLCKGGNGHRQPDSGGSYAFCSLEWSDLQEVFITCIHISRLHVVTGFLLTSPGDYPPLSSLLPSFFSISMENPYFLNKPFSGLIVGEWKESHGLWFGSLAQKFDFSWKPSEKHLLIIHWWEPLSGSSTQFFCRDQSFTNDQWTFSSFLLIFGEGVISLGLCFSSSGKPPMDLSSFSPVRSRWLLSALI